MPGAISTGGRSGATSTDRSSFSIAVRASYYVWLVPKYTSRTVDLVMTPNVVQLDLGRFNPHNQHDTISIGHTYGVIASEFALECVKAKMWLIGVYFQIAKDIRQSPSKVRSYTGELARPTNKVAVPLDREH